MLEPVNLGRKSYPWLTRQHFATRMVVANWPQASRAQAVGRYYGNSDRASSSGNAEHHAAGWLSLIAEATAICASPPLHFRIVWLQSSQHMCNVGQNIACLNRVRGHLVQRKGLTWLADRLNRCSR
jgi:hypothetical protein